MHNRTGIENHTNMIWETKQGPVRLKNMDTVHIRNTMKTVKNGNGGAFCGHSSQDWLIAMKLELQRRDSIGDRVLSSFPTFFKEFNRVINSQDNKSFTTRGIKESAYDIRKIIKNREVRAKVSQAISQQTQGNQKEKSLSRIQGQINGSIGQFL